MLELSRVRYYILDSGKIEFQRNNVFNVKIKSVYKYTIMASAIEFEPTQTITKEHKIQPTDWCLLELKIYLMLAVLSIHLF